MPERVYLDRIEGKKAVLLFGEEGRETGTIPARLLPKGALEGAALDLTLSPVKEDTTKDEVQDLMDDLLKDYES
jgi:hypothetical protein